MKCGLESYVLPWVRSQQVGSQATKHSAGRQGVRSAVNPGACPPILCTTLWLARCWNSNCFWRGWGVLALWLRSLLEQETRATCVRSVSI